MAGGTTLHFVTDGFDARERVVNLSNLPEEVYAAVRITLGR
jgi:hypothetical protein